MLNKITFVFFAIWACNTASYAQQNNTIPAIPEADAINDAEEQRTIVLHRETKNNQNRNQRSVENKPIIIVLPQQKAIPVYIEKQQPVTQQMPPVASVPVAEKNQSQSEELVHRPLFFMGVEGGISNANYASNSLRNWEYGYRWENSNSANSSVVRVYTGYNINPAVSAETGILLVNQVKGSNHSLPSFNYDTLLHSSGFDFLMRYTSESGLFIKGGYSYIETVGKSYIEHMPNGVPTGQMRWTNGTESSMHIVAGGGLNLKLTDNVSLTFTVMQYRTVFTHMTNRFNFITGGILYKF